MFSRWQDRRRSYRHPRSPRFSCHAPRPCLRRMTEERAEGYRRKSHRIGPNVRSTGTPAPHRHDWQVPMIRIDGDGYEILHLHDTGQAHDATAIPARFSDRVWALAECKPAAAVHRLPPRQVSKRASAGCAFESAGLGLWGSAERAKRSRPDQSEGGGYFFMQAGRRSERRRRPPTRLRRLRRAGENQRERRRKFAISAKIIPAISRQSQRYPRREPRRKCRAHRRLASRLPPNYRPPSRMSSAKKAGKPSGQHGEHPDHGSLGLLSNIPTTSPRQRSTRPMMPPTRAPAATPA